MNISVSNIAWKKEEDKRAFKILEENGIYHLDIAPTRLFDSIDDLTKEKIQEVKEKYQRAKFNIVAMQSLLYGANQYSIFDGENERNYMINYLKKVLFIAQELGIKTLVFGSPKNRYITNKNQDNKKIALKFFRKLSDIANKFGVNICLEANPKEYGCNFITDTFEAVDFIKIVNRKNFKLNLDISTILLNKNNLKEVIEYSKKYIKHVHISSPYLKGISKIDNKKISKLLKEINYKGYVSLEMKPTGNNLKNLENNVGLFGCYR